MKEYYTLTEVTSAIRVTLEQNFEHSFSIKAEVASINKSTTGHVYFEFVEKKNNQNIVAKMRGAMWANIANYHLHNFKNVNGRDIRAGDELLFLAKVTFHQVYGISLIIENINAEYTLGKREQIKKEILKRLEKEGLLEKNREMQIDKPITSLAIISSETAAGYQDLITHLNQNKYGYKYKIKLFQSTMQGETASPSIVNAFKEVNSEINENKNKYQAVILTRGGGADLDLDCFSTYEVCKALAECKIPVITGIGHERDTSFADLCAHSHIKTPTAVADYVINISLECEQSVNELIYNISNLAIEHLNNKKNVIQELLKNILDITKNKGIEERDALKNLTFKIVNSSSQSIINNKYSLNETQYKILDFSKLKIKNELNTIDFLVNNMKENAKLLIKENNVKLENNDRQIKLASPKNILKRGFVFVKKENKIIKKGKSLKKNDEITIHFLDINIDAEII